MALSTGSIALASDVNTVLNNVNQTLTRYGIANVATTTQNATIYASLIRNAVTQLLVADTHAKNISVNTETATLNANNVAVGDLIKATNLNTISTCATNIYNRYCSCNCNFCSCDNCYCSCNCDFCSCDNCYSCGFCSCNNSWYCTIGSEYTCFLPESFIITSQGPKKVEDIKSGDFVLAADGTFDEVISTWTQDVVDEKIKTYRGDSFNVSVTKAHNVPFDYKEASVLYPTLNTNEDQILFRAGLYYPKEFIDNIILFGVNLKSLTNSTATFKYNRQLLDLCNKIITTDFDVIRNNEEMTIYGKINDFYFSQYLNCFIIQDHMILFPNFIYNFSDEQVAKLKATVDNDAIKFTNIEQCIQIKFLFNCHGWDYKRVGDKLIYVKDLIDNKAKVEIVESVYSGKVYNFSCKNSRFIAGEIIMGDGYV